MVKTTNLGGMHDDFGPIRSPDAALRSPEGEESSQRGDVCRIHHVAAVVENVQIEPHRPYSAPRHYTKCFGIDSSAFSAIVGRCL
jgi:hypothetical protein